MTAPLEALLAETQAVGATFVLDATGRLVVRYPRGALPADLAAQLRARRAEIRAMLERQDAPAEWTRDDWLDFIEERAAILEFDGGHPRAEAEAHAYAEARAQWLRRHPAHVDPACCADCGQAIEDDRSAVNVVRDGARVHAACWTAYLRRRHADAAAALARVGITPPRKETAAHA